MRAIAFFQGRGGGGGREWQRALPLVDTVGVGEEVGGGVGEGVGGGVGERIETACRQWREVDDSIRKSAWHQSYLMLINENLTRRSPDLAASAEGDCGGERGRVGEWGSYGRVSELEELRRCREKSELKRELCALQSHLRALRGQHSFRHELKGRMRVLRRLGYLSDEGVVTVKGRAACEVEMLQDLAVVEMMLQGAFSGLTPPDVAAICSCLIAEEKDDAGHATEVKLANTLAVLRACQRTVYEAKMEAGLKPEDSELSSNSTMMDVVHMWCSGASFADVCAKSKMFEGSIIRTLRREAELLRQLEDAAAAIGDKALESKFKETSAALQRGLPFSASLYL
jgi:hypothetical protein